jgi:hypothetical protein
MKSKTFETIRVMVADDPLTDAQMRELSGADQDDVVDGDKAAAMLGVELQTLRTLDIPRIRINRFLRYRIRDVRKYRDDHTW